MNIKAVDEWSPIHWIFGFMIGFAYLKWDIDLMYICVTLIVWEIVEYLWLGKALFGRLGLNGKESAINITSDLFFGLIGSIFAYYVYIT